jgi:hypothetical protein
MLQLSQAAVADALDQQLLPFTAGGDINLEGTPYIPQAGQPYIASRLSSYNRSPLGVGPDTAFAALGTYQLSVNRPAIGGLALGRAIAARLVLLFARGTALTLVSGQVLTIENATEQPIIAAGDWITIPVTVNWYVTG